MGSPKFKGIIFDFNGVLLWDIPLHERIWELFSRKHRGKGISRAEWNELNGRTSPYAIKYLLSKDISSEEVAKYEKDKETTYQKLIYEQDHGYKLSFGAVELLDYLRDHNIRRAIATSAPQINVEFYFENYDLLKWFKKDEVIFADGSFPSKPAPDIYLRAAAAIKLDPSECIVVEDSVQGVISAKAAGAGYIIGVESTRSAQDLISGGADETVVSLEEIKLQQLFA